MRHLCAITCSYIYIDEFVLTRIESENMLPVSLTLACSTPSLQMKCDGLYEHIHDCSNRVNDSVLFGVAQFAIVSIGT